MTGRGVLLAWAALVLALGGCASADDAGAQTSPSPSPSVVEATVSVRDGTVTPKPHRVTVPLGEPVRLLVTSDVDDTLHVHGFEVEEPLEAGRATTVDLVADQPGVFAVETHETGLELLQLEVR